MAEPAGALPPYSYGIQGTATATAPKRARTGDAPPDTLANPVLMNAAKPMPRMSLMPVVKWRPPPAGSPAAPPASGASTSVSTAAAAAAAAGPPRETVRIQLARPPVLQHLDDYLSLVGATYYQHSEAGSSSTQWALIRRTTLGVLTAPVREPMIIDKWSPYEIALFESALCLVGKHFSHVSGVVKTKTTAECIEFYYMWKKSAHYSSWKENYVQTYGDVN